MIPELDDSRNLGSTFIVNRDLATIIDEDDDNYDSKILEFITSNPDYYYSIPYEGYCIILFKAKPDKIKVTNAFPLHRGSVHEVKIEQTNYLCIVDLD